MTVTTQKPGSRTLFVDPEPWEESVDGASLLDEIESTLNRFCILPPGASEAIALWTVHTYAMDAWAISPILLLRSPEKQCGKTTLFSVLSELVWRRQLVSSVTAASVFRIVDKYAPTLLIDECDRFLSTRDDLVGILNSGFTRAGALVHRTEGRDTFDVKCYSCWSAKALAMIGSPPATIEDRSITILMRRRLPHETVERLRLDRLPEMLRPIRQRARRFVQDHLDDLRESDPSMPAGLSDRGQDCWRPLISIADLADRRWGDKARNAATRLAGLISEQESSLAIELLSDLEHLFGQRGADKLDTKTIVAQLNLKADRPWQSMSNNKGITANRLARMLREFQTPAAVPIRSADLWIDNACVKGYRYDDFVDAFERYLRHEPREGRELPDDNRDLAVLADDPEVEGEEC